jgi:GNAT superfamily N-acetyltransferase
MADIRSVLPGSPLSGAARALFSEYRDFLETIASTHCFNFSRYAQEIADLPGWYTDHHGELLLALVEEEPAGCIAFRAVEQQTCEIKRLFIAPAFRRQGLARALVAETLDRARQRGFRRAILDTDIVSMAAAYTTYVGFGFREYTPPGTHAPSLRFLEREL